MEFLFSLVATVAVFSAGVLATSLIFFLFKKIFKKQILSYKITFSILSLSFLVATSIILIFVFKIDFVLKTILNFKDAELIYFAVVFLFSIIFFIFTKFSTLIILPLYLIFSLFVNIILSKNFPREKFYQVTANNQNELNVKINCYQIKPFFLILSPRVWYILDSADSYNFIDSSDSKKNISQGENEFFKSFQSKENFKTVFFNFLLFNSQDLKIDLPQSQFYPVIYKINLKTTLTSIKASTEQLF